MKSRKHTRLPGYDYSGAGGYFVTLCTKGREHLLSSIRVGSDALIGPQVGLTEIGKLVDESIQSAKQAYETVSIPCYVVMPNHVHLLIVLEKGPMGASGPTVGMVVRGIKTKVSRALGYSVWQEKFYDHVVRNHEDYLRVWEYIDSNPAKWREDEYFAGE